MACPSIALGDFNLRQAGDGKDEAATYMETATFGPRWMEAEGAEGESTYPQDDYDGPIKRYDRVLVRPMGNAHPVLHKVLPFRGGEKAAEGLKGFHLSDHAGVMVEVKFGRV